MKKLLTILGIVALTVSASGTVVSCSLTDGISKSIDRKVNDLSKVVTAALRPAIAHTIANRDTGALWSGLSGMSANDAISGLDINDERSVKDIIANPLQFNSENTKDIAHLSGVETRGEILQDGARTISPSTISTISGLGGILLNLFASQGGFQPQLAHSISPILGMASNVLGLGNTFSVAIASIKLEHIFGGFLSDALASFWDMSDGIIEIPFAGVKKAVGTVAWIAVNLFLQGFLSGFLNDLGVNGTYKNATLTITLGNKNIPSIHELVDYLESNSEALDAKLADMTNVNTLSNFNKNLVDTLDFSKDDKSQMFNNTISNNNTPLSSKIATPNFTNGIINLLTFIFKPLDSAHEITIFATDKRSSIAKNQLAATLAFILSDPIKATIGPSGTPITLSQILGLEYDKNKNPYFSGYESQSEENTNQEVGTLFNSLNLIFDSGVLKNLMSNEGLQIFKTLDSKSKEHEREFFTPLIDERNFKINKISHSGFDKQDEDSILEFDITFTNPIFDKIINLHNETDKDENGIFKVFKKGKFHVVVTGSNGEPYKIESLELISKT
ncbi:hypothetical protein [Spiroplasma endosymbiont of Othius punctulatus]|uniref:hypothetical protein n=1 Tax=Spiroplasma endosymbiont of Othius punctulatus TaxID=3066289 RepID=UPI0030CD900B